MSEITGNMPADGSGSHLNDTVQMTSSEVEAAIESPPNSDEQEQELIDELDALIDQVQQANPDYKPPPFSPQGLLVLIEENLAYVSPDAAVALLRRLRSTVQDDLLDMDTWRGVWYIANYMVDTQAEFFKRRIRGEYETDAWGYDPDLFNAVKPFYDFLYYRFWRVQTTGIENIPEQGRALLVANHSGQLPWDQTMVALAVMNEHPAQRLVRTLFSRWLPSWPFVSTLSVKFGQVLSNEENGIRLLQQDQLVAVYPEGSKGIGKLYKNRYHLAEFGRGGFVRMAVSTGSPIIPVSVVGAEETFISLHKSEIIARMIGIPYFPISPTWPWLGPLGLIPLPTKWYIDFGEPIRIDDYSLADLDDSALVSQLSDQVRNTVQQMVLNRLADRKSVFMSASLETEES